MLQIRAAADTEAERAAVADLERTTADLDLARWTFTNEIVIEEDAIPHSHPVLTLTTRNHGDVQLSSLLHEQLHWHCAARNSVVEAAKTELRTKYPGVVVGWPEGAEDEESSYLHLTVCWLEVDAVRQLIGDHRADSVADLWIRFGPYRSIHRTVVEDRIAIGEVVERHGLRI